MKSLFIEKNVEPKKVESVGVPTSGLKAIAETMKQDSSDL